MNHDEGLLESICGTREEVEVEITKMAMYELELKSETAALLRKCGIPRAIAGYHYIEYDILGGGNWPGEVLWGYLHEFLSQIKQDMTYFVTEDKRAMEEEWLVPYKSEGKEVASKVKDDVCDKFLRRTRETATVERLAQMIW